jgi:hypothetical protein
MTARTYPAIAVGAEFALTGVFLKNTGQIVGGEGLSRWRRQACDCGLCHGGSFLASNEPHACQDDPRGYEDVPPEQRPKWRHFNVANVYQVGRLDSRNCP